MTRDLQAIADQAAVWAKVTFDYRTGRLDAGDVNVDWILPDQRVTWTEIHSRFPQLRSVDGRLAFDAAWRRLQRRLRRQR